MIFNYLQESSLTFEVDFTKDSKVVMAKYKKTLKKNKQKLLKHLFLKQKIVWSNLCDSPLYNVVFLKRWPLSNFAQDSRLPQFARLEHFQRFQFFFAFLD